MARHDEQDLCAAFDIGDPEFCRDPFPTYEYLREHCPALHSDQYFEQYGGFTLLTRYDDVKQAVLDWRTYSSAEPGVTAIPMVIQRDYPLLPVEMDPPDHTRYRALIAPVFRARHVEAMREAMTVKLLALLDHLTAKGSGDLVAELAVPFSVGTLAEFMQLPKDDEQKWVEWGQRLFGSVSDVAEATRATLEIEAYLDGLITEREAEPRDDFISMLLGSEIDGHRLSRDEVRSFSMLVLATAGHETSASAMSVTLYYLAEHPHALADLRSRPELLPTAVEEMLRYSAPVQMFCRNATRDVTVHGQTIAKNSVVATGYGSANMDPSVFSDPQEVRLDRTPNKHLTFGAGPHLCVGAQIARLEMELLLTHLPQRFEALCITDHDSVVWNPRGDRRGIWELPAEVIPLGAAPLE